MEARAGWEVGVCQLSGVPIEALPASPVPPLLVMAAGGARSAAVVGAVSQSAACWEHWAEQYPEVVAAARP